MSASWNCKAPTISLFSGKNKFILSSSSQRNISGVENQLSQESFQFACENYFLKSFAGKCFSHLSLKFSKKLFNWHPSTKEAQVLKMKWFK